MRAPCTACDVEAAGGVAWEVEAAGRDMGNGAGVRGFVAGLGLGGAFAFAFAAGGSSTHAAARRVAERVVTGMVG